MDTPFQRTERLQSNDRFRGSLIAVCCGMALLSTWLLVFCFGGVTVDSSAAAMLLRSAY